jgi:hypothetical protein
MEVITDQYQASMTLTKRQFCSTDIEPTAETRPDRTELIARLKALIKHDGDEAILFARIEQIRSRNGIASPFPFISIGKTLPDSHPVFRTVRLGDLKALQTMISQGLITLRERDSWGTPLLHVRQFQISPLVNTDTTW